MNKIIQTLGISIILATITIVSVDVWLSKAALATTEEEESSNSNNPIVSTETKSINGEPHEIITYEDGTKKQTSSKTGECAYLNPRSGVISPCETDPDGPMGPSNPPIILSSPEEEIVDLPPYGEGGLVDPNDLPTEEGNE